MGKSPVMDKPTRRQLRAALDLQSPDPQGVDLSPGARVYHEKKEQAALWSWVRLQWWRENWFHVPNERASRSEALSLASQGVVSGIPDNWLILSVGNRPGAVGELKRQGATRSALKHEQREWLLRLEALGWAVGVHRGWLEAREFFEDYVNGQWSPDPDDAWWR